MNNRYLLPLLSILFLSGLTLSQENKTMTQTEQIIEQIRLKYAPDKRVALFKVQAETLGDALVIKGETSQPQALSELHSQLKAAGMKYTDSVEILPDTKQLKDKTHGIINLSVANIRTRPDHPEEMATQALLGTRVRVLKKDHGWYLIQTPDGYIAWAEDDAVEAMNEQQAGEWTSSKRIIYTADYGFSYTSPDENSPRVSDLVKGNILKLTGIEKGFVSVLYPDGRKAYIPAKSTMDLSEFLGSRKATPEELIENAKCMMGLPYLWGGTSEKGVDCSGFTKTIYYLSGVIIPRDASQQVNEGELVDTEQDFGKLQPGDLLFFGTRATAEKKERITHVAMYIGNGEYIHSAGRVKINSLEEDKDNFSPYRFNTFIRAKRMLSRLNQGGIRLIKDSEFYFEGAK